MTIKRKSKIKEILQQAEAKYPSKGEEKYPSKGEAKYPSKAARNTLRVLHSKKSKRSKREVRSERNMNEDI
jgi:hypothetical protein